MDGLVALANSVRVGQLTLQQFRTRMIECISMMGSNDLSALVAYLHDLDLDDDLDTDVVELQRR